MLSYITLRDMTGRVAVVRKSRRKNRFFASHLPHSNYCVLRTSINKLSFFFMSHLIFITWCIFFVTSGNRWEQRYRLCHCQGPLPKIWRQCLSDSPRCQSRLERCKRVGKTRSETEIPPARCYWRWEHHEVSGLLEKYTWRPRRAD